MTRAFDPTDQVARYSPLGLVANPFFGVPMSDNLGTSSEVASQSNLLIQAVIDAVRQDKPRPIWVARDTLIPDSYSRAAEGRIEQFVGGDKSLNTLHSAIPLFGMKNGAVRAVIRLLGERLIWREFELTLIAYVERVLAEQDDTLISFQVMGPEALASFTAAFSEDPSAAVQAVFGEPLRERIPSLSAVADMRQLNYVGDGAETAAEDGDEVDETVGNAPGLGLPTEEQPVEAEPDPYAGLADYIIEYTSERLSPVIGRALRVYRERGLEATANELNVTKAPRKTLSAMVRFARARFEKVVIIWDGFDNWLQIDPELRSKIVGLMSEMRWSLDGDAVFIFIVGEDQAPELEESFGSGSKVTWDFPSLLAIEEDPDTIIPEVVERWFANATAHGAIARTLADPGLAALLAAAAGSMRRLVLLGQEALEDAADRGATSIDEQSVRVAIEAVSQAEADAVAAAAAATAALEAEAE